MAGKRAIGGTKQFSFRSQPIRTGWIQGKPYLTRGGVVPQIFRHGQGMLLRRSLLMLMLLKIVAAHPAQVSQATFGGIGPENQVLVQTITGHHPGEAVQISQENNHPATDAPKLDQYVIGMLWQVLLLLLLLILWTLALRRRHMRALSAVGTVQHRRRRGRIGRWHVIDAPSFEEVAFLRGLSLRCRLASTSTTTIIIVWIGYDLFVLIINIQAQRNVEGMPESLEVGSAGQLENYG